MNRKLEILNLQRQIKADLKILNWSIASFASKYLIDNNEYDVEEYDVKTFQERVKKQLVRSTTNLELLLKYNNFIRNSDEYKKLGDEYAQRDIQPLTGFTSDYVALLNKEVKIKRQLTNVGIRYYESNANSSWTEEEIEDVLKCASQHADTIGSFSHGFQVVKLCDDGLMADYLVFWAGDIGFAGGSGTWGPAYCLVRKNHWGNYNIAAPGREFYEHLKIVETVVFKESILQIKGVTYGPTCHQRSPNYKLELQFRVVDSFVGTVDLELVDKKEIGYEDAS